MRKSNLLTKIKARMSTRGLKELPVKPVPRLPELRELHGRVCYSFQQPAYISDEIKTFMSIILPRPMSPGHIKQAIKSGVVKDRHGRDVSIMKLAAKLPNSERFVQELAQAHTAANQVMNMTASCSYHDLITMARTHHFSTCMRGEMNNLELLCDPTCIVFLHKDKRGEVQARQLGFLEEHDVACYASGSLGPSLTTRVRGVWLATLYPKANAQLMVEPNYPTQLIPIFNNETGSIPESSCIFAMTDKNKRPNLSGYYDDIRAKYNTFHPLTPHTNVIVDGYPKPPEQR